MFDDLLLNGVRDFHNNILQCRVYVENDMQYALEHTFRGLK